MRLPLPEQQPASATVIRPPFMLYTLHAEPTTMGSGPAEKPAVALVQHDAGGEYMRSYIITPDQARALAAALTIAAHEAEHA